MGILETVGICAGIALTAGIIGLLVKGHQDSYEIVELDPNDPEMKAIVEKRTDFINMLLAHLSVNMGISPEEVDENSKMTNLSPELSILTVAQEDILYTYRIKWDKSVKVKLFRNSQENDLIVGMSKTFRIKDNTINEVKYTRFFDKFKEKAFPELNYEMEDAEFRALAVAAAKQLVATQDEADLKNILINFIKHFNRADYADERTALIDYASILAYLLKFHREDLEKWLKTTDK